MSVAEAEESTPVKQSPLIFEVTTMNTLPVLLTLLGVLSGCVTAKKLSTGLGANARDVNANSTNSSASFISERDTAINSVKIEKAEATRTGDITLQILNRSKKPNK